MRRSCRLSLEELAPYLLEPPSPASPLSWPLVFGNDLPVEIEVGFGKGLFLVTAAQASPAVNFLGIEIARKYVLFTATRLVKRSLRNVRVVCGDARQFLAGCVAEESVQAVHVYFPDPWWKKRHQKRRVFTPEFAGICQRVLRPGGLLSTATDVESYFQLMTEAAAEQSRLARLPPPHEKEPSSDLDYLTNFERKFRMQGKPIYRAVYRKSEGL